jgi:hypothetical protein
MLSFPPMTDLRPDSTPQFETAEYAGTPGSERCKLCNQPIGTRYYRIGDSMVCPGCGEKAQFELPKDSHAAYMRALLFGSGAAILGLIIYAAFGIMTGWVIGYLSLAVGYMVGKAMMKGSNGLGGRRYQITAVVLTYAAVSMAAVPIGISQLSKQERAQKEQLQNEQRQLEKEFGQQPQTAPPTQQVQPQMGVGAALGYLALLGLASPFLELWAAPVQGIIGLVILLVGVQIAWKLTAGTAIEVSGPFDNSTPASA